MLPLLAIRTDVDITSGIANAAMRAYHLTSEKYALQSMRDFRLKLALLEDMNDPFELMALEARSLQDRSFFKQLKADMHQSVGVLCFSRSWRNPVLWSHYADKHRGICLGFDIPDEHILKVDYRTTRLKAELEDRDTPPGEKNIATRLISTKYSHWRYEDEVRLLYRLEQVEESDGLYFAPYYPWLTLREIIIGPRSDLVPQELRQNLSAHHETVAVFRSRLAFRSYSVVRDRRT